MIVERLAGTATTGLWITMRERHHTDPADVDLPMLMHALSDPLRLEIVDILDRQGEMACAAVCHDLSIGKSNASHHFRVLRESGVVLSRTSGRDAYVSLRMQELDRYFPDLLPAVLATFRRQAVTA